MREAIDMRDFFASQVMIGIILSARPGSPDDYAALCFDIADAMMTERAKRQRERERMAPRR